MSAATTGTPGRWLGERVLAQAAARPDHVALSVGGRDVGYAALTDAARRWAARLVEACDQAPARVAVLGQRSETSYTGALAALVAGAAFVPLSPGYPADRSADMLQRADVDAVVAEASALDALLELLPRLTRTPLVLVPDAERADLGRLPEVATAGLVDATDLRTAAPLDTVPVGDPDRPAYLLFTSGSTGRPKGVPVTHRNVTAFLDAVQERYAVTAEDRFSQTFEQTFDLSVFDLFLAWENGARVCAMDPIELLAPARYVERHQITVWFSVPSVAALMRRRGSLTPGSMPSLRWSLFCGEALPAETAALWQAAAPSSTVENLYGPTELTIACTAHRWDPVTSPARSVHGTVPIGRPFPGLHAAVVDEDLRPVPDGASGELCVAGPQTTPGYWRAPELTAQRYVEIDGRRHYRTGDVVRLDDGELVHLGRRDDQVQVGGHRVELGEVEGALRHGGAVEAAALLWPDPTTITAVVTGVEDGAAPRAACAARLPAYMVPREVRVIDQLPLNGNGKTDKAALRRWLAGDDSTDSAESADSAGSTDTSDTSPRAAGAPTPVRSA